jgi:hypothetical protein
MIVWHVAAHGYLSMFVYHSEIPLRAPPPLWNVQQRLFINEQVIKDFKALSVRKLLLNERLELPPIVQISVIKRE